MTNLITADFIKSFITLNKIPLAATQSKLCIPIIIRICRKMSHGIKFDEIKVCDNMIIDGHHRYLSALIMKFDVGQVSSNKTSATETIDWNILELDQNDWDTPAKIAHLNESDAKYNNLEIKFVNQIALGKE